MTADQTREDPARACPARPDRTIRSAVGRRLLCLRVLLCAGACGVLLSGSVVPDVGRAQEGRVAVPRASIVVGYSSHDALVRAARRAGARIDRLLPQLREADLLPLRPIPGTLRRLRSTPGISSAAVTVARREASEPSLVGGLVSTPDGAYEWQFAATHADNVPAGVLRSAQSVTIAVIDSGADLTAPDLSAKAPTVADVVPGRKVEGDATGHGTFVASLAAGSVTNGEGIAGFGGDARLLIVKVGNSGTFTDFDVARGIVYAVDHGAKIINLSMSGTRASDAERRALAYAARHGVLPIVAGGNGYADGNPVQYPAALVQSPGARGTISAGLVVAASDEHGVRASFSSVGGWISLAAPGAAVFGAVAGTSPVSAFPRISLPGSHSGLYGFGSGTSYAAPEVAGAAALVWAANPELTARDVAALLARTASGKGRWTPELGYGVLDVAAAVAAATPSTAGQ